MPLINGQKMACEPCIRGHRSTKCTHASERLMVPVRKPGRPLSSCPHPASRPCSCSAVTAAIPKKQKCGCGTASSSKNTDKEGQNGTVTPPSPAAKGPISMHRVQKSTSKTAANRRSIIDPSSLERMDASQLNVISPLDAQKSINGSNGTMPAVPNVQSYGAMGFMPAGNGMPSDPAVASLYQPLLASPMLSSTGSTTTTTNGHASPQTNGTAESSTAATPGSCCGGGKPTQVQTNGHQNSNTNISNGIQPKSRCSSETETSDIKPQPDLLLTPQMPQVNGMMVPHFQTPIAVQNGIYPFYSQPTIFAYPPHYGSYLQPLQPEQWRQMMSTIPVGQPESGLAYHVAPPNVAPSSQFPQSGTAMDGGGSWTSHHCSCGEACQCIGCATHPYNEATQNYVRSACNIMLEDTQKPQTNSEGNHGIVNDDQEASSHHPSNGRTTPVRTKIEGTMSPSAQTPSDTASGLGEDQIYSANDYLFVSYPFGEPCEGESASCPCGDDCQCIGCAIHNNPLPIQRT